jgi:hypothetical protein
MEQFIKRGDIKYKARAKQINSFSGMIRRRNITPTDIDGIIDYNGNAFVILEGKYGDAEIPKGQRMALENLANAILLGKKKVLVIIFRHYVNNTNEEIIVSNQLASEIYFKRKWFQICFNKTVLELIEIFEKDCDNKNFFI